MTTGANGGDTTLSPDEAFGVLGNDTRMQILRTLGEADDPLSFSELRERVGVRDSGQFNYHLDKLVGHFVYQNDDGYDLHRAGERVIEAVVSGAVTDAPVLAPTRLDPTQLDLSCPYCGNVIDVSFHQELVEFHCSACSGLFGKTTPENSNVDADSGFLGRLSLPPAGLRDRTAAEVAQAAWIWGDLEVLGIASGVCPRCSAPIHRSVSVCESHDAADGICETCDRRYAAQLEVSCTNCLLERGDTFKLLFLANTELLAFLTTHGINPLTSQEWVTATYDEEILSTEPFKGQFTFSIENDRLTVTVDDDLRVADLRKWSIA